ncbi:MAG: holliday junction DNA helicase RuvA [Candidatus Berkelbacteria bacterium Gr01-1014_85]|uniref:Holliday junction branch migration complex subunit RuvA n=1 Tax=Candidatus Berkelbacteria bacterium Gr01-1014_85 TaxID=2017150 RepID=A0A554JC96_9BACT|nr:MAG: holliday junction DNA helicase RuvA [Candidatus Berkelbacteria bacterium Gr01-1014_85]
MSLFGSIRGQFIASDGQAIILETSAGIGYRLSVPLADWPELGQTSQFWTELIVREDSLDLFGFAELSGLKLFRSLVSVSGIGPKTALSLISRLGEERLKLAIDQANLSELQSVPGIGQKAASKIILELKNKLVTGPTPIDQAIVTSLAGLGYDKQRIGLALSQLSSDEQQLDDEAIKLKLVLQKLSMLN